MVRIPGFHSQGSGSISGGRTEIQQAAWYSQKTETKTWYLKKKKEEKKTRICIKSYNTETRKWASAETIKLEGHDQKPNQDYNL